MKINRCHAIFICDRQDDCLYFEPLKVGGLAPNLCLCRFCSAEGKCESEKAIAARVAMLAKEYN